MLRALQILVYMDNYIRVSEAVFPLKHKLDCTPEVYIWLNV